MGLSDTGGSTSQLSLATYYSLLKLLSTCCSKSPAVAQQLLQGGLLDVLRKLLATSALLPGASPAAAGASMLRSPDQLYEVMSLLCQLLPPVVDSVVLITEGKVVQPPPSGRAAKGGDERTAYFDRTPGVMRQAVGQVLPLLLQYMESGVGDHLLKQVRSAAAAVLSLSGAPGAFWKVMSLSLFLDSFLRASSSVAIFISVTASFVSFPVPVASEPAAAQVSACGQI